MEADEVLLFVALSAPLAGTLLGVVKGPSRHVLRAGCLVAAVAWATLAARATVVSAGGFHAGPLLAAAGCGAALLVAADAGPSTRRLVLCGGLGLSALVAGLAAGERASQAGPVLAGLAIAAVCAFAGPERPSRAGSTGPERPSRAGSTGPERPSRRREALLEAAAAGAGIATVGLGFVLAHDVTGRWALAPGGARLLSTGAATAFLAGSALLVFAGARAAPSERGAGPRRRTADRSIGLLLAGGLTVGLLAAPLRVPSAAVFALTPSDSLVAAAVVLGALAVAAAWSERAPLAFALLALAVAAGPVALTGPARLLGAAAVLCLAVARRPAWLLAVPGGVALAITAADVGNDTAVALTLFAGAVAAALALRPEFQRAVRARRGSQARLFTVDGAGPAPLGVKLLPDAAAVPAALAGVWLFVAPGSWSWTGTIGLEPYDVGAAVAVAAGLLAAVALALGAQRSRRPQPRSPAPKPRPAPPPAPSPSPAPAAEEGGAPPFDFDEEAASRGRRIGRRARKEREMP